jgi:glycosyltransferase involved in cell wall biosynthesis
MTVCERPTIGVIVITWNEEDQIAACLETVTWADEVIVVDDCSTDRTVEIAEQFGARVIVNKRTGFDEQRNLGMRHATSDWLLHLDADERVTPALRDEILSTIVHTEHKGFWVPYRNYWLGRHVRFGGWGGFKQIRLALRDCSYWENAIHEQLRVDGSVSVLHEALDHHVDGTYAKRLAKSNLYTSMTAEEWFVKGRRFSLLMMFLEPLARAFNTYLRLQGFRDGIVGLFWALHQMYSHFAIYVKLWELEHREIGCRAANERDLD